MAVRGAHDVEAERELSALCEQAFRWTPSEEAAESEAAIYDEFREHIKVCNLLVALLRRRLIAAKLDQREKLRRALQSVTAPMMERSLLWIVVRPPASPSGVVQQRSGAGCWLRQKHWSEQLPVRMPGSQPALRQLQSGMTGIPSHP